VILPYIEEQNTYDLAATDPLAFVSKNVTTFTCPTRRGSGLLAASSSAAKNGGAVNLAGATQWMRTDFAGNRGAWASSPASPSATDVLNRATTFGFVGGVTAPSAYPPNDPESLRVFQAGTIAPVVAMLNTAQAAPGVPSLVAPTGGVIFLGSAVPPAAIRDGASNTYVFGEKYLPVALYAAGDAAGNEQCAYVGDSSSTLRGGQRPPESDVTPMTAELEGVFGGPHPGGFNAAMCDGSVRNVAFDIDARVHFLLSARADRQPVPPQ
jgi:prepilin-type processing-associated H-X9-DG protein